MNKIISFLRDYALARFLIPVGIILIVFGIIVSGISNTRKDYPQTDAVVSKAELYEEAHTEGDNHVDATYTIYVRYTVDGKEYEQELGVLPEMKPGTTVKIDYDPKDPTNISQPVGKILPIAMMAAGAAMLIGGIVSIIHTANKNKTLKKQEEEWQNG